MVYRGTWAEIDLDNIAHNIKVIKELTNKNIFAVVKANGYGLGDDFISEVALYNGASYLAVATLEEGISLRLKNFSCPILILGYIDPEHINVAKENNLTVTVPSLLWVYEAVKYDLSDLKVHIKIDTGMNRIGIKDEEDVKESFCILNNSDVIVEGIYSHLACADVEDNVFTNKQYNRFKKITESLNYDFDYIHILNSDGSINYDNDEISNSIRLGIGMLGISSYDINLKPAFSLYTKIANIKKISTGEFVGYGASYIAKEDEFIATLPIGYADGWKRGNQGRYCFINGVKCEFVGRICMDQSMVKVPEEFPIGTIVELIGPNISVEDVAKDLNTISYEIFTSISNRVNKIYKKEKR